MTTMALVEHIHLDKNTLSILFQKGTICSSLLNILSDSDRVHIYLNNSILLHKQQWVSIYLFIMIFITAKVIKSGLVIFHLNDY
jgi:hypothetical protein